MEEDVAGPQEEILGERYTTCSRCGRPVLRSKTTLLRRPESDETHSDQEEICPKCLAEMQQGERPT